MDYYNTFIPCLPPTTTAQQHKRIFSGKNGKAFLGTDSKGIAVQNDLISLLLPAVPPEEFPRDKPLKVEIGLIYPYRKSEKKRLIKSAVNIPHTSRPDMDNLLKFLLDCMTRCRFWNDDSQIYELKATKHWGANPGILICLRV
ncbi:MAG: RusA family crossover junction endodeoxyribonuclease [Opitutales bacterium]|nr:RusA family crossover junction endodeoxyribonuclease [Opitutales bacterium]